MWPDRTRLGIEGHLFPSVGQRSHLSRGDYSLNRQGGASGNKMLKADPGRCTSLVELEKWPRNPHAAATAASTGYLPVRSCNSRVLPGDQTPKINLQSTVSGKRGILLSHTYAWAMLLFQARDLGLQKRSDYDTCPLSSELLLREELE